MVSVSLVLLGSTMIVKEQVAVLLPTSVIRYVTVERPKLKEAPLASGSVGKLTTVAPALLQPTEPGNNGQLSLRVVGLIPLTTAGPALCTVRSSGQVMVGPTESIGITPPGISWCGNSSPFGSVT